MVAILRARGFSAGPVERGRQHPLRRSARLRDGTAWEVERPGSPSIRAGPPSPFRLERRGPLDLGRAEKSFVSDGRRLLAHHGPAPREARAGLLTVVVLTASRTAGDALDDAFFVQGVEGTRAYLMQLLPPPRRSCSCPPRPGAARRVTWEPTAASVSVRRGQVHHSVDVPRTRQGNSVAPSRTSVLEGRAAAPARVGLALRPGPQQPDAQALRSAGPRSSEGAGGRRRPLGRSDGPRTTSLPKIRSERALVS